MFEQRFDSIFDKFKGTDSSTWKEKIIADLKGKPFEGLISVSEDGIETLPFYTAETTKNYRLNIPLKREQHWQITEYIKIDDTQKANADALFALKNGANAILFDFQNHTLDDAQMEKLVKDFLLDAATFYAENTGETATKLFVKYGIINNKKLYVPQQKSTVNELLYAVQYLFQDKDSTPTNVHFCTGQNYFLEIAKLRAFRWLVQQINQIQKINKDYILFSETGFEGRNDEFVENNILRNTTEAMSAILGGCDALIIHPHEQSSLGKRIARNIQHLLYYESNFKQIPDVVKSTYYIEYLTFQLAKKVWEKL